MTVIVLGGCVWLAILLIIGVRYARRDFKSAANTREPDPSKGPLDPEYYSERPSLVADDYVGDTSPVLHPRKDFNLTVFDRHVPPPPVGRNREEQRQRNWRNSRWKKLADLAKASTTTLFSLTLLAVVAFPGSIMGALFEDLDGWLSALAIVGASVLALVLAGLAVSSGRNKRR